MAPNGAAVLALPFTFYRAQTRTGRGFYAEAEKLPPASDLAEQAEGGVQGGGK